MHAHATRVVACVSKKRKTQSLPGFLHSGLQHRALMMFLSWVSRYHAIFLAIIEGNSLLSDASDETEELAAMYLIFDCWLALSLLTVIITFVLFFSLGCLN